MPENSTLEQHAKAKKEFLRILNRWKSKHNITLELHAVLDIVDNTNAHWDVVAYSDSAVKPLRTMVSNAWARAGGLRQSLVPMDDEEIIGQSKYQTKNTKLYDLKRCQGNHYIPAEQAECGINHHWSTGGFWQGRSVESIWKELIQEWFYDKPEDEDSGESANKEIATLEPTLATETDPQVACAKTLKLTEFRQSIERRLAQLDEPRTIASRITQHLPTSAQSAPTVAEIANRWGLSPAYTRSLLIQDPGAKIEPFAGNRDIDWIYDKCWVA